MQAPQTEVFVRAVEGATLLRNVLAPGEYVIGSDEGCELHIEAEGVAPRHALLTINFDHALIEDVGSECGTLVSGQRIAECTRLWPNQKIQIGNATVELRRVKTIAPTDVSLAPSTAMVRLVLPEEFLRDKKYEIGGVVARGGMGAILDAREAATERKVAMKVMLDSSSPDDLVRFVAEARTTAQLEHPNIVPVHELSIDENDQVFYTMKFVRGTTLGRILDVLAGGDVTAEKKYPLGALLTVFQKICDAIAFAHSKGVIHRDLKPANIMLGDFGEVLVMDWGLAKVLGRAEVCEPAKAEVLRTLVQAMPEAEGATLGGSIMGTPQYMSPEQARGEINELDARTDIYALGSILYHLLALRPPVEGDAEEVVRRVAAGEVTPLDTAQLKLRIPDSLVAVVRKAMAFDKGERYAGVAALQEDLAAFQNGFATRAENAGAFKQLMLLVKRQKTTSIGVAAVLLVAAVFGTRAVVEGHRATHEATHARQEAERAMAESARAETALANLKKTGPDLLALAASEAASQHFDSALTKVDGALALDPELVAGYWRRGWILLAEEKLPEAIEALHLAQSRDPANDRFARLIPLAEKMAAVPDPIRHSAETVRPIYNLLTAAGAIGESAPFIRYFKQTHKQNYLLVRKRVEQWLGKAPAGERQAYAILANNSENLLEVRMNGLRIGTFEPLRDLPIERLDAKGCGATSLEPLRGMPLVRLDVSGNPIPDLGPLRGMPLEFLAIDADGISDLSALEEMKLKVLHFSEGKATDLSPLARLPLEVLIINRCPATDFSPLRGLPLRELNVCYTQFSDGRLLEGMPLEKLTADGTPLDDLSPLVGLPLKDLSLRYPLSFKTDYTPLIQIPSLERLATHCLLASLLPLRDHPGLKEINWKETGYRPVAEFWADYDAQQVGAKQP